jgi:ubiquinone/menaquinone biosynthesis C-methylase UbiE
MTAIEALWDSIGSQLKSPNGQLGRLAGAVMAAINREPNDRSVAALDVCPEDTILELGCGPGMALKRMASAATRGLVIGLDSSPAMLAQAARRNRATMGAGRTRLVLGRFDALPFHSGSVDKILAVNVAYFFRDDADELREVHRVLRPGGRAVVYATDRESMAGWKFAGPRTHRLVDTSGLRTAFRLAGFEAAETTIRTVVLSFGIRGLIAVGRKTSGPGRRANARHADSHSHSRNITPSCHPRPMEKNSAS